MLIIRTRGAIEGFAEAVQGRQGMELIGEAELDRVAVAATIGADDQQTETIATQIYYVATDEGALRNLLIQWRYFKAFERMPYGLAPYRHLFRQIQEIRFWTNEDRLSEREAVEGLRLALDGGDDLISLELELWFRRQVSVRQRIEAFWKQEAETVGGALVTSCSLEAIRYHAVLLRLPRRVVADMIEGGNVSFVADGSIYLVQEVGQSVDSTDDETAEDDSTKSDSEVVFSALVSQSVDRAPITLLLDTLPVQNHVELLGRVFVDDPDGWESTVPVNMRDHGTSMASLIVRGDIDAGEQPLPRSIVCSPILKPVGNDGACFPDDRLIVDLLHERVVTIMSNPAYAGIRIINLSIGDTRIKLRHVVSKLGRIVDYLAWRYRLLFIISAGNVPSDFELSVGSNLSLMSDAEVLAVAFDSDVSNDRLRICSPADSINALTVGGLSEDACITSVSPGRRVFEVAGRMPALYSRRGRGFRKSLKPDLAIAAGRMAYRDLGRRVEEVRNGIPGQRVASATGGGTFTTRGTSNGAALVSRQANLGYDVIQTLRNPYGEAIDPNLVSVAMKALLAHASDHEPVLDSFAALGCSDAEQRQFAMLTTGYGAFDEGRFARCDDQRALLIGTGELSRDKAHEYRVPIPPALSGVTAKRRFRLTLAYFSPVNSLNALYRGAKLQIKVRAEDLRASLGVGSAHVDRDEAARGTLQQLVFEGKDSVIGEPDLHFSVECREDGAVLTDELVPYAVVVSIEVDAQSGLQIYDQIEAALAPVPPLTVPVKAAQAPDAFAAQQISAALVRKSTIALS